MPPNRIGNRQDFESLFRAHFNELCRIAMPILRDSDQVKDAVQEVFIDLWRKKDQLEVQSSFKAYLYKAVVYKALDHIRKQARIDRSEGAYRASRPYQNETTAETVAGNEMQAIVQAGIDKMPPRCAMVFTLSRYQGLKNREIAENMDISIKTVENQLGKALKIMRAHLEPYLQLIIALWLNLICVWGYTGI